jgi:stearoyl-CoA desaturase (delta-9 desaturase)
MFAIARAAEQLAARFNSERIALAITSTLQGPELSELRDSLLRANRRTHLGNIPSREEFLAEAKVMFARSPSLDEIVDRAHKLLLALVGMRLTNALDALIAGSR